MKLPRIVIILAGLELAIAAVLILGCSRGTTVTAVPDDGADAAQQFLSQHNRAVGLMGQYDYDAAYVILQDLARSADSTSDIQVDWSIAALNRRQDGDAQRARELLSKVIQDAPNNLRAHYCLGILDLDAGDPRAARERFSFVAEQDPSDAYAQYYAGQCEFQLGQADAAIARYELALKHDPYFRSAYYGGFQACAKLGQQDRSREFLEEFQKLEGNPQSRLAEIKYTRMGPKATLGATALEDPPAPDLAKPKGAVFNDPQRLTAADDHQVPWSLAPGAGRHISVTDLWGTGELTLLVAGASHEPESPNLVFRHQVGGEWRWLADHPLAGVGDVQAVVWGDFDNDGLVDAYFCCDGPNQLWRQTERDKWMDVTASTRTGGGDRRTNDGQMFDADHDGDLDLLLVNDGPNELLNNNLDGTFRPLAEQQGLTGGDTRSVSSVVWDIDHDRDLDYLVLNQRPPHHLYLNDRLWEYRQVPTERVDRDAGVEFAGDSGYELLLRTDIQSAVAVDLQADGQSELIVLTADGLQLFARSSSGIWQAKPLPVKLESGSALRPGLAITDVDGDGRWDLWLATGDGWAVRSLPAGQLIHRESRGPLDAWAVAHVDAQRGPSLVGLRNSRVWQWAPGPGRYGYLSVAFTGKDETADQMRSNRSGIGVQAAARNGSHWTSLRTLRSDSGPGQSLQPLSIGLRGARQLDFVSVTWPDGVFQTELQLERGREHRITETQRQVASCPVVFTWNGTEFQFVTDVLGAGGIGFNVADGEYGEPRPWENLLLPRDCLQPRENRLIVKIGEPMEEVCYLDAARVITYDLPVGWSMSVDERFAAGGPIPTGKPLFYRDLILPVEAVDDRGRSVIDEISRVDFRAVDPGRRDWRFVGRTEPHFVQLRFDRPINGDRSYLVFDGWIEYPYSQTMFAAWQANANYVAPTLQAYNEHEGVWQTVLEQFGYMAGMPRQAVVRLPELPSGTCRLRLSSNVEVYWDRVGVVHASDLTDVVRTEQRLVRADVLDVGFPRRTTGPQHLPNYDYQRRVAFWDTRHPRGFYSRFGSALPLLSDVDDAVAVFGPGEEVHLEFQAPETPPVRGRHRRYVLELNGWCKDMDLYTRDGETVGPLPRRASTASPAEAGRAMLHRENHTRYRSGY